MRKKRNMIGFVVNPQSANGKTGKIWPELKAELTRHFGDSFVAAVTEYPLHAVELTRKFLSEGVETIIAIGGDGT
ncbi:MAG TPA: diacylglycerol kinase family lipid kinase, partial [Bacteroidetes bacterium]|nr:diacylglycerol kinase family lipid kinase [Bacteroidota bacterium]